jgi:hypothetical protein
MTNHYNERAIARHLAREKFSGMLLVVDNTYHLGDEADLLIVNHRNLHYIDVEIKVSRADLKADRHKDKWRSSAPAWPRGTQRPETPLEWPRRVWKHYYCVAEPVWQPELLEHVGPRSGVFTIRIDDDGHFGGIRVQRKCTANPAAKPATPEEIIKLAYLANVRMHEAYRRLDECRAERSPA